VVQFRGSVCPGYRVVSHFEDAEKNLTGFPASMPGASRDAKARAVIAQASVLPIPSNCLSRVVGFARVRPGKGTPPRLCPYRHGRGRRLRARHPDGYVRGTREGSAQCCPETRSGRPGARGWGLGTRSYSAGAVTRRRCGPPSPQRAPSALPRGGDTGARTRAEPRFSAGELTHGLSRLRLQWLTGHGSASLGEHPHVGIPDLGSNGVANLL
jgi:hypothetical protein